MEGKAPLRMGGEEEVEELTQPRLFSANPESWAGTGLEVMEIFPYPYFPCHPAAGWVGVSLPEICPKALNWEGGYTTSRAWLGSRVTENKKSPENSGGHTWSLLGGFGRGDPEPS